MNTKLIQTEIDLVKKGEETEAIKSIMNRKRLSEVEAKKLVGLHKREVAKTPPKKKTPAKKTKPKKK